MALGMHEYLRLCCVQMIVMERDILQLTGEMSKESRDNWLVHRLQEHQEVLHLRWKRWQRSSVACKARKRMRSPAGYCRCITGGCR